MEVPCGGAVWRCRVEVLAAGRVEVLAADRVEVLAAGSGAGVSLVGFWVVAAGLSAGWWLPD